MSLADCLRALVVSFMRVPLSLSCGNHSTKGLPLSITYFQLNLSHLLVVDSNYVILLKIWILACERVDECRYTQQIRKRAMKLFC